MNCVEMAEPIEMPCGMLSRVGPGNILLRGDADNPREGALLKVSGRLKSIIKHSIGVAKG